ncbi:MAG: efflux transporter outer membrane subunit [Steroidobacteraceae bacterium]
MPRVSRVSRLLGAAGALAALGLAGCSLGPAYHRPVIRAPAAWQTRIERAPATWPSADWWRGFHSPELVQLIGEASRANDDLAAAVARVHEAEAEVTVQSAPLFPSVDGSFTGERQKSYIPSTGAGTVLYNEFSAEIQASYELDFWGKNRAIRAAALATEAANRYDRATVELTVMSDVATAYFSVLALNDRLRIARDNLAAAQKTLRGLTIDENVGTTTSLDVAQQATTVATLSAAIPPLLQQRQQQLDALAVLVGKTPEELEVTGSTLASLSPPPLSTGIPSGLLARRPDVAEAEAQLIAANANIRAARAAFFPTIDLTAAGGDESAALRSLLTPGSAVFSLSGGVTQPIFHAGAILGEYRLSKAQYAELLADYHKAVISAFGNVEDALAGVEQTHDEQRREKVAVDRASKAYDLSQREFHAGTINILTVLSTETALFTAEDAYAQVKLARLQALVGLYSALGGGWHR